ncbi:PREDICTED: glutamate receptor ionotropic, kainate 2-like isoform X2 [Nicrophorus vespilloides]|uniref:Glutamate receptor ionotropic, kainate 2-like isoform X2 n=1 Tax=Nicrophorus vespilloides TaxID=110193 RepID=A0ABM1MV58_NICVS|nr:PREDICTED: glutamate receptor ionotropic, kainate 2-like isoform X2 [Nicrophorus vespilloides]
MRSEIVLVFFIHVCHTSIQKLKIGGVFDESDEHEELAFSYAVNMVNSLHPNANIKLVEKSRRVKLENTLEVSKAVCDLLDDGVVAIFGPSSQSSSPYVQSICDTKEIPHIETHWNTNQQRSLVNFYPNPYMLGVAFLELVRKWDWKMFTILYDDEISLMKVDRLLMADNEGYKIRVRQLEVDVSSRYRNVLNTIKRSGEKYFILVCSIEVLEEVLLQAQQVGIITDEYNYIITNPDMHTIDLGPYQYGGCNITGVRLMNPEHRNMIELAEKLQRMKMKMGLNLTYFDHFAAWKLTTKTALLVDAVSLFFETIRDFKLTKPFDVRNLGCDSTNNWEHGYSITNLLKTKSLDGLTGIVKFDYQGVRTEFNLEIIELAVGGLIKIGTWNVSHSVTIERFYSPIEIVQVDEGSLTNKSFVVITALTPPYGLLKETTTQLSGNDRFEGFGIDLIHELSLMLGFNYTFVIQEDGANGNFDRRTKQWNGMIREIIDGRADLAITDLTITSERENAVDFTMPFMNLGISILYRKPEPVAPSLFTFASPFSLQVWMLLGVAYFFVSISLFIIGRLCPSEWTNPYPCVEEPEFLINQFSLRNSLWFTIGSLMQQGTEIAPIGISTRMVAGIWWFFTLIMVSSYTANLAAFLTVETLVTSFKNIEELAEQTEIKYGAKKDGATSNFFRDSDIESYKVIGRYMYKHPTDMTADNDEGVRRVETENYAFLMESTTIEYIVERHCTLAQVGGLLDDKGYGIAMRKDSKYRNILSAAVLKLQETGKLTSLKIKWWKEKRGGGNCASRTAGGAATPLGLKNGHSWNWHYIFCVKRIKIQNVLKETTWKN